jgi:2-polyprenyl-3-methyl-5-hydroxy-6-metoxy-1,4-benzoquinol methylase
MNITSPLTGSANIVLENSIETKEIIGAYQNQFGIDVKEVFQGMNSVHLYKCLDSHYRFFYPFNISGNTFFYEQLQKFDWYYIEWKWEHEACLKYFQPGNKVLEIGCAKGSFIERVSQMGSKATGLELNLKAATEGRSKGLPILTETIEEHAGKFPGKYDVVCSFHVMEHIADIKKILKASIQALKPGGKLIISVPNNDSYLGLDKNYLNMPPHHMGLWNKKSLKSLELIFNLKLIEFQLEQLQPYHKVYYSRIVGEYYSKKFYFLPRIIRKIIARTIPKLPMLFSKEFKGYTIQAVYEKI